MNRKRNNQQVKELEGSYCAFVCLQHPINYVFNYSGIYSFLSFTTCLLWLVFVLQR